MMMKKHEIITHCEKSMRIMKKTPKKIDERYKFEKKNQNVLTPTWSCQSTLLESVSYIDILRSYYRIQYKMRNK